jgi:CRISPR/Cas system-associated protein Cas10 (large subunit of type III CRISPR-Cas system)
MKLVHSSKIVFPKISKRPKLKLVVNNVDTCDACGVEVHKDELVGCDEDLNKFCSECNYPGDLID